MTTSPTIGGVARKRVGHVGDGRTWLVRQPMVPITEPPPAYANEKARP